MKMYVLVNREILDLPQCAVQAAHAVSEFVYKNSNLDTVKNWIEDHKTLIILQSSKSEMKEVCEGFD